MRIFSRYSVVPWLGIVALLGLALRASYIEQAAAPFTATLTLDVSKAQKGGIIGGYSSGGEGPPFGTMTASASRWPMPITTWLFGLGFCMEAANGDHGRAQLRWRLTAVDGFSADINDLTNTVTIPNQAALPCAQNLISAFPIPAGSELNVFKRFEGNQGDMKGWSAITLGTGQQPMGVWLVKLVGAGGTSYTSMGQDQSTDLTEADIEMPIAYDTTLENFCILTTGTQPASGGLKATVRDSGADTGVEVTVPANSGTGEYCATGLSHGFVAGDTIAIRFINAAASTSSTIQSVVWTFSAGSVARSMVIFPHYSVALPASTESFSPGFTRVSSNLAEAESRAPFPVDGTLQTFYCVVSVAPGSENTVLTVYRNGLAGSVSRTVTPAGGTGVFLGSGTQAYSAQESFNLSLSTGAGTAPNIVGCSAEYVY